MRESTKNKAWFWGLLASLIMAGIYLGLMFITMTLREVWLSFATNWYLISGIVIGFGVQIGLWVHLKNVAGRQPHAVPGASGAMSGTAMVACCAHHLAEILPILGISGAAIFLTQYQRPLLILGVAINTLGVAYMLHLIQQHKTIINKIIYQKEVKL